MNPAHTPHVQVTLTGNLGGDPKLRSFPGREYSYDRYDPVIDDFRPAVGTQTARSFWTASVAVDGRTTRWVNLVDHKNLLARSRKGDRLRLRGYFQDRTYTKAGVEHRVQEFLILEISTLKLKIRHREG